MNNLYPVLPSQPLYQHSSEGALISNDQHQAGVTNSQPILVGVPVKDYPLSSDKYVTGHPSQDTTNIEKPKFVKGIKYAEFQDESTHNIPRGSTIENADNHYENKDKLSQENSLEQSLSASNDRAPSSINFRQIGAEMFGPTVQSPATIYKIESRNPQLALCQRCNRYVQTNVSYKIGRGTLITCAVLAALGAIPCFWIPCCMKMCKDAVHCCPLCNSVLGTKKFEPK